MHGEDLQCRGKPLVEAVPIDTARSASIPDVMREGHRRSSVTAFERDPELLGTVGQDKVTRLEILVDYRVIPVLEGMDLVAREHRKGIFFLEGAQGSEVVGPLPSELLNPSM